MGPFVVHGCSVCGLEGTGRLCVSVTQGGFDGGQEWLSSMGEGSGSGPAGLQSVCLGVVLWLPPRHLSAQKCGLLAG